MRILLLAVFFGSSFAHADTQTVSRCIEQKYQALNRYRGIVAAVVDADSTHVMNFGQAKLDQIFEIGSITKTFTGNLLAQEVVKGSLKVNDAIPAEYQKPGSVITYEQLTTHTSGIIPGVFSNYESPNPDSPYEGLTIPLFKKLYSETDLVTKPGTAWSYSNIGVGLLGLVIAEKNQASYESLVQARIFNTLGMKDSYFEVPASEVARFPEGNVNGEKFSHWNIYNTAISPAGSIRSTIADMALYARANLLPESTPLKEAIELSHQPFYEMKEGHFSVGMNWILEPQKSLIWHNGSTVGFNSILAISTQQKIAVVALTDSGIYNVDADGNPVEDSSFQDAAFDCLK